MTIDSTPEHNEAPADPFFEDKKKLFRHLRAISGGNMVTLNEKPGQAITYRTSNTIVSVFRQQVLNILRTKCLYIIPTADESALEGKLFSIKGFADPRPVHIRIDLESPEEKQPGTRASRTFSIYLLDTLEGPTDKES